jgi:hypothetical protein
MFERPDTSPFKMERNTLIAPKPRCDEELSILSDIYFGAPLRLLTLRVYGNTAQYEVEQDYNAYHGEGFRYGKCANIGYDHSRIFWRHVIGNLYCGGIARASYGQANIKSHRDAARLEFWIKDRRNPSGSSARETFVRLARSHGAGENIARRNRPPTNGVLSEGRVDGASAASSNSVAA